MYTLSLSTVVFSQDKCPTKLLIIVIILEYRAYLTVKKREIVCVIYFLFSHFLFNLKKTFQIIWENFISFVIFDTCNAVYNWSISLLPPIVLDNPVILTRRISFIWRKPCRKIFFIAISQMPLSYSMRHISSFLEYTVLYPRCHFPTACVTYPAS